MQSGGLIVLLEVCRIAFSFPKHHLHLADYKDTRKHSELVVPYARARRDKREQAANRAAVESVPSSHMQEHRDSSAEERLALLA